MSDTSEENQLHETAVGRIAVFCVQAIKQGQLGPEWSRRIIDKNKLARWQVDEGEILKKLQLDVEKEMKNTPGQADYLDRYKVSDAPTRSPKYFRVRNPPRASINSCASMGQPPGSRNPGDSDHETEDDNSGSSGGNSSTQVTPCQKSKQGN